MDFKDGRSIITKISFIIIFVVLLTGFMSIQDVFAITLPITIPMGAAGGAGNFDPAIIKIQKDKLWKKKQKIKKLRILRIFL